MSNSNGIISKPVNIETDLGYVLGTGSGEVSVNFTSPMVRPWARYKGIALMLHGSTGKTAGNDYWKGSDGKCGFAFDVFSSFGHITDVSDSFAKQLYNGDLAWVYDHPVGLPSSPFRPLDFDGYDHSAESPIGDLASTILYLTLEDGVRVLHVDYDFIPRPQPGQGETLSRWLGLDDIEPDRSGNPGVKLSSYYLGVMLYNGTTTWVLTSTTPVGSGGLSMAGEFPADQVGSWQLVPFLSSIIIPLDYHDVTNGSFLSFYNKGRIAVTIKLGSVQIIPGASFIASNKVSWSLDIINEDGARKYFTNPFIAIQRTTNPLSPAGGTQISPLKSLSDFDIAPRSTLHMDSDTLGVITFDSESYDPQYTYWVRFGCDQQGYVTDWAQIEQYTSPNS